MVADIERTPTDVPARTAIWYADALGPPGLWHVTKAVRLHGHLDVERLRTSLTAVVRRHDALRTVVESVGGLPVPRLHDRSDVDFQVTTEPATAFDLAAGPLLRASVHRCSPDEHVLTLTSHRLVCDAPSLDVVYRDLIRAYTGELTGLPSAGPVRGADRAFWAARLAGASGVVPLPTDRARRNRRSVGRAVRHRLSEATPPTAALAALRILLWRHTRQPDLLIGWASDGSPDAVGPWQCLLPLRNPLSPDATFSEVLAAETAGWQAAHEHAVPADAIAELLGGNDIQVTMGTASATPPWPGLRTEDVLPERVACPHDLAVTLTGDTMTWAYNDDVFDEATIHGLAGRLDTILAAAPDLPIRDLPVLTAADRLVLGTNATEPGAGPLLVEMVRDWEQRAADSTAARQGEATRTYRELAELSDRVAGHLRAARMPAETAVGVLLDRTVDLPVVLLGVAKANCATLPLDPAHPVERLHYVLADAGAAVVITDTHAALVPEDGPRVLTLADLLATTPEPTPVQPPLPDQLAYILYTSGSTGRPKGVGVTHAGLANCLRATRVDLAYRPGERLLAVTTAGFDIAMLELFLPLVSGGETVVSTSQQSRDGQLLAEVLDRQQIRFMQATPMTWQMLLLAGWRGSPGLVVSCGGDVVSPALAARVSACTDTFWHTYGPTETSLYTTSCRLPPGRQPHVLPVGSALPGTRVMVLDDDLRQVPPGAIGEVCVGGIGVARGYLGQPGRTATVFVPDPFADGKRLYRTGDLGRVLPDGRLELHGRRDRQLKIRGHRIEPGEIENALQSHPDVAVAAVVVHGDRGADQRLTAFLQLAGRTGSAQAAVGRVREFAAGRLPKHMVPGAFAVVPTMPLNANGKIDRLALSKVRPPARADRATAADPVVARIDALMTGLSVSGGTVADAARLVDAVNRAFDIRLDIAAAVAAPTAAALAVRVRLAMAAGGHVVRSEQPPVVVADQEPRFGGLITALDQERPVVVVPHDREQLAGIAHGAGGKLVLLAGERAAASWSLEAAAWLHEVAGVDVPVVLLEPGSLVPAPAGHRGTVVRVGADGLIIPAADRTARLVGLIAALD